MADNSFNNDAAVSGPQQSIQYQSIAEPLFVPAPEAVPDHFQPIAPSQTRGRVGMGAHLLSGFFFFVPFDGAPPLDSWLTPQIEVVRPIVYPTPGEFAWNPETPEPVPDFFTPSFPDQIEPIKYPTPGEFSWNPETPIGIEQWRPTAPEWVEPPKPHPPGEFSWNSETPIGIEQWRPIYPDQIEPIKYPTPGEFSWNPDTPAVVPDQWYPSYPEQIEPIKYPTPGEFSWNAETPIGIEQWRPTFPDQIEPPKPHPEGGFSWDTETPSAVVVPDLFLPTYPDPVRPIVFPTPGEFSWDTETPAAPAPVPDQFLPVYPEQISRVVYPTPGEFSWHPVTPVEIPGKVPWLPVVSDPVQLPLPFLAGEFSWNPDTPAEGAPDLFLPVLPDPVRPVAVATPGEFSWNPDTPVVVVPDLFLPVVPEPVRPIVYPTPGEFAWDTETPAPPPVPDFIGAQIELPLPPLEHRQYESVFYTDIATLVPPLPHVGHGLYEEQGHYHTPTLGASEPFAKATVTAQSVANTTAQLIALDTVDVDPWAMLDVAANKLVVQHAGYYHAGAFLSWAADATGIRQLAIRHYNAANVLQATVGEAYEGSPDGTADADMNAMSGPLLLQVGDYLQLYGTQTTAGNLNADGRLWLMRIAQTVATLPT